MGDPIEIDKIRAGDTIRVVNPKSNVTFIPREITDFGNGFRMVWNGMQAFGGRPGETGQYNTFFLVERPSQKDARMLTELKLGKTQIPEDILDYKLAPMLGLKKTAKKGGRRRRKTRKSRR